MTMNATETQLPGEPAVASSDGLEANVKRYNQFTWWIEPNGWTIIGDYDCNRLAQWLRTLDEHEVVVWCDGYEMGNRHGVEQGKTIKANEVKRALCL